MKKTIHLYGEFKDKYGGQHVFENVNTPFLILQALRCKLGEQFYRRFLATKWQIFKGDVANNKQILEQTVAMSIGHSDVHFIPVAEGNSGEVRFVVGAVIAAVGYYFLGGNPSVIQFGVAMMIGGAAEMLAGKPKVNNYNSGDTNKPSKFYNGAVNTVGQGGPIPLIYGQFRSVTTIVSAGMESARTLFPQPVSTSGHTSPPSGD